MKRSPAAPRRAQTGRAPCTAPTPLARPKKCSCDIGGSLAGMTKTFVFREDRLIQLIAEAETLAALAAGSSEIIERGHHRMVIEELDRMLAAIRLINTELNQ